MATGSTRCMSSSSDISLISAVVRSELCEDTSTPSACFGLFVRRAGAGSELQRAFHSSDVALHVPVVNYMPSF